MALLEVKGLDTCFKTREEFVKVVKNVSFSVEEGEIVGLVGESGSGKTITALSVMRLLPPGAYIDRGEILYKGKDLFRASKQEMRRIRGSQIGMIFQEPDLNPIMNIESQLKEILPGATRGELVCLLARVGIPDAEKRLGGYPYEMSGGMKQRVMIAMMALAVSPGLLIADEPTTALDVTVQAQILSLITGIVREKNMGMLFITHNLALVAEYADRILIMRRGEIVEEREVEEFFKNPKNPYSRNLLEAVPRLDRFRDLASRIKEDAPGVLEADNLSLHFLVSRGLGPLKKITGKVRAVDGVSFRVREGETLGIVGESGCGKTTLARLILRLVPNGDIVRDGAVNIAYGNEIKDLRKNAQIVFQEAQDALNPRRSAGDLVVEGPLIQKLINVYECESKAKELFNLVGIDPESIRRFPSQFSSGQRQRIAIARALASEPKILIMDEPVASLDVSVQKEVIDLLLDLKSKLSLTCIMISHDIALVKDIANRIAVMYLGKIVEMGPAREIVENPLHPYTKALISAVPIPDPKRAREKKRIVLKGEIPSPLEVPSGCRFRTRCPFATELCADKEPEFIEYEPDHFAACHYANEILEFAQDK